MELTKDIAIKFLKERVRESKRPNYPFRSRFRHTLRVLMWAERLQKLIGGDLEVLTYSAILHDCAWNGEENHAITSYNAASEFLNRFDLDEEFKRKVLEGIRYHNQNDTEGLSLESYILMDADELDEVGALCLIWDTLGESYHNENVSYNSVVQRMKKYLPRLKENVSSFHFEESLKIYQRKIAFMEQFIKEAEEELEIEL